MLIGGVGMHSAAWLARFKRIPLVITGLHHAIFDTRTFVLRRAASNQRGADDIQRSVGTGYGRRSIVAGPRR